MVRLFPGEDTKILFTTPESKDEAVVQKFKTFFSETFQEEYNRLCKSIKSTTAWFVCPCKKADPSQKDEEHELARAKALKKVWAESGCSSMTTHQDGKRSEMVCFQEYVNYVLAKSNPAIHALTPNQRVTVTIQVDSDTCDNVTLNKWIETWLQKVAVPEGETSFQRRQRLAKQRGATVGSDDDEDDTDGDTYEVEEEEDEGDDTEEDPKGEDEDEEEEEEEETSD